MPKELQNEGLEKGQVGFVGEKGRAIQTHFVLWKKRKGIKMTVPALLVMIPLL